MKSRVPADPIFARAACKRLTQHEVDRRVTNGHEFQGVRAFREILGTDRLDFDCRFVFVEDDGEPLIDDAKLTWYEVGRKGRAPEFRAYFSTSLVWDRAQEGDHLYLIVRTVGGILAVFTRPNSDFDLKLSSLLGVHPDSVRWRDYEAYEHEFDVVPADALFELFGLGQIGGLSEPGFEAVLLDVLGRAEIDIDDLLKMPTKVVSKVAREVAEEMGEATIDPDDLLLAWSLVELQIFQFAERRRLLPIIEGGFDSVDDFLAVVQTTAQVRRSRAGRSLENHFQELLERCGVRFKPQCRTEGKKTPDFVLPGFDEYHDPEFPDELLSMIAVKRTCKDRWRQIISEADRIPLKYLVTLESPISGSQINEMYESGIELVIPRSFHINFDERDRTRLRTISELLELVRRREAFSDFRGL